MSENLQNVVSAAERLSPNEQLELIEAILRLLQQSWWQSARPGGEYSPEPGIPGYVKRTSPVTSLKQFEADFWPDNETADDINAFVAQQRKDDLALEK